MEEDTSMDFWDKILKFNNKYFMGWRLTEPIFYSNAIAGETGELCGLIKKIYGGGTNNRTMKVTKKDLAFEIVDIWIYSILLLELMGISKKDFMKFFDEKIKMLYERMER